jgi:hypothetical protein
MKNYKEYLNRLRVLQAQVRLLDDAWDNVKKACNHEPDLDNVECRVWDSADVNVIHCKHCNAEMFTVDCNGVDREGVKRGDLILGQPTKFVPVKG